MIEWLNVGTSGNKAYSATGDGWLAKVFRAPGGYNAQVYFNDGTNETTSHPTPEIAKEYVRGVLIGKGLIQSEGNG